MFRLHDPFEAIEHWLDSDFWGSVILADFGVSFILGDGAAISAFKASAGSISPIFELLGTASDLNPPLRRRPPLFFGEVPTLGV